ncbi:hypothetical protein Q0F99_16595 [Rathayibacter oskolensis]|uniref:hypothetical protein n=1 Tax=Rathayibacter oskolensis TaxID=1891671 RepID=UPI00265E4E8F|nr:hypothetical protein [Rathayibacter oskolensis]WKK71167.1 hypothetical protein Q0F99_16595 [Rathayibacter oskolensis]
MLLGLARAAASEAERAELDAVVGRTDASASDIARAQEIVSASGALDRLEERIRREVDSALDVLPGAPLREEGVAELRELAERVSVRAA